MNTIKQTYDIVGSSGFVFSSARLESDQQALLFFNEYLDEQIKPNYRDKFQLKLRKEGEAC